MPAFAASVPIPKYDERLDHHTSTDNVLVIACRRKMRHGVFSSEALPNWAAAAAVGASFPSLVQFLDWMGAGGIGKMSASIFFMTKNKEQNQ
jgi:hypothetical protein